MPVRANHVEKNNIFVRKQANIRCYSVSKLCAQKSFKFALTEQLGIVTSCSVDMFVKNPSDQTSNIKTSYPLPICNSCTAACLFTAICGAAVVIHYKSVNHSFMLASLDRKLTHRSHYNSWYTEFAGLSCWNIFIWVLVEWIWYHHFQPGHICSGIKSDRCCY